MWLVKIIMFGKERNRDNGKERRCVMWLVRQSCLEKKRC